MVAACGGNTGTLFDELLVPDPPPLLDAVVGGTTGDGVVTGMGAVTVPTMIADDRWLSAPEVVSMKKPPPNPPNPWHGMTPFHACGGPGVKRIRDTRGAP